MQQTEKYKFNIIETSDSFSPDALNANARTAETQLAALAAADTALSQTAASNKAALEKALAAQKSALEAADAALKTAIGSGGTNARIEWGSYMGDGTSGKDHPTSITTSIKPCLVVVGRPNVSYWAILIRPMTSPAASAVMGLSVTWEEKKVSFYSSSTTGGNIYQCNEAGITYSWAAIGVSPA